MKKVIFISALAIAAAVSCTKSDIVDTKFNEAISFENYLGRDAMTKASVYSTDANGVSNLTSVGLYGYYTGKDEWKPETNANLWNDAALTSTDGKTWTYTGGDKYWTNDADKYTFLAYAPKGNEYLTTDAEENTNGQNPSIIYATPLSLNDQIDVLYANTLYNAEDKSGHVNMVRPSDNTVALTFKHALSRITVKASQNQANYQYNIKKISLTSNQFSTNASLKLNKNGVENWAWTVNTTWAPTEDVKETYVIFEGEQDITTEVDFAKVGNNYTNYLMVVPVNFAVKEGDVFKNTAKLKVTYTTEFDGQISTPMTKELDINTNFEMGKAYSFNLVFAPNDDNKISFTVSVSNWEDEQDITAGNPEESPWK